MSTNDNTYENRKKFHRNLYKTKLKYVKNKT